MHFVGVDGAPGGWVAVAWAGDSLHAIKARSIQDIRERWSESVVAIDIPIGLPDNQPRECDLVARRMLGARKPSVFPVPMRSVLRCSTYRAACEAQQQITGKMISLQCYNLFPNIRDVDNYLEERPADRLWVREVHPELCWLGITGAPMSSSKRTSLGRAERVDALRSVFHHDFFPSLREQVKRKDAADDDLLDACAAAWTARRIYRNEARSIVPGFPTMWI